MLHGSMVNIDLVSRLDEALQSSGLVARGVFKPVEECPKECPPFLSGVLIGHFGGGFWPVFKKWHLQNQNALNPLDTWSKDVLDSVANQFGATAVYPSDKPYFPFQQWAKQAEGLKLSPLGLLIHPRAGLWHAYRGALLFEQAINYVPPALKPHPCDTCDKKACLTSCPVDAVKPIKFNVAACRNHLEQAQGQPCMTGGCLARNACPVGAQFRYTENQQAFHQKAFASV